MDEQGIIPGAPWASLLQVGDILPAPNWCHCDTAFVGFYVPFPEEFTNFFISSGWTHKPSENENKGDSWLLPNHSTLLPNCETSIFLMLESVFKNSFQFKLSGGNKKQKGRILLFVKCSGKQQHVARHWSSTPYFSRFICSHITIVKLKQLFNRFVFPKKSHSQLLFRSFSSLSQCFARSTLLCLQTVFCW